MDFCTIGQVTGTTDQMTPTRAAVPITENLSTVLKEAYKWVHNCDCGLKTSCFGRLHNAFNDRHHEVFKREDALRLLDQMRSHTAVTRADLADA